MKNRLIFVSLLAFSVLISLVLCLPLLTEKLSTDDRTQEKTEIVEKPASSAPKNEDFSAPQLEVSPRVELSTTEKNNALQPALNRAAKPTQNNKAGVKPAQRDVVSRSDSEPFLDISEPSVPKSLNESLLSITAKKSEDENIFLNSHPVAVEQLKPKDRNDEKEPIAGADDNPYARSNWFMYQRKYPFDEVPAGARRLAFEEVLSRPEGLGPQDVGTTWASIGPLPTTSAFPNNGGFTSGRINSIAISPTNNQLILIGSATGGIWRSTNGGTSFTPVSDTQADLAVGAIAFAPSNSNIVYAGMGDLDNGYYGTGILKSTDAGATWTRINTAGFPDRGNCVSIKVDPTDPNKVYVAQYNSVNPATGGTFVSGVYISTNGGVNWTNTLSSLASDLAIHPTNPQIVYAGVRFSFGAGVSPGLYKSTNGGTSWARVYTSPFTGNQSSTREFRVAVTPASPERVYIYFGTTQTSPAQIRVERSDDAGATWTNRGTIPRTAVGVDPGQFGYNTYLAVSPTDANTVYVGARDVFRSTDSGVVFTNINNSFAPPYPNGDYTPNNQKFHADQQAFAFEPGSGTTFYCGNDGGIWKTTNSGTTFTSLNATLSLTQFVGIGLNPVDPTRSYGGAQDNGSQRRTGGTNWNEFSGGDGGKLVINPLNPAMIFHSYVEGSITRNTNNGATYTGEIANAEVLGEPAQGGRIAFYPPIVGNGVNARIYVGTWRLLRCDNCEDTTRFIDNGGTPPTWTAPGGMFDQTTGGDDVLSAIAVSRSNNQVIYTGSRDGRVMASNNGGATWTDITAGLPTRSIAKITVSPTNPALVYLTVSGYGSGHVFRSTNSGQAWTDISSNLPNIPTSAFLIDPLTPTTLYAGTDIGVFRSTNNGGTWAAFNNGLPPVPVMEFSAQANGLIQIGTYGRGAYELPTTGGATPTPTATPVGTPSPTPTVAPSPTPGGTTTVSFTGPAVAITDNSAAGVNIPVVVGTACTVSDLNFRFDGTANANPLATTVGVNHSWVGDLRFRLTSPAGTSVTFIDRPGFPVNTSGCSSNNLAAILIDDDGGFPSIENQCGANTDAAFPSGSFSPNSPLSAFDGQNAAGTWILNVSDNVAEDTGLVRAFSLIFAACAAPTPTPTPTPVTTPTPTPTPAPSPSPTPTPNPSCTPNANIIVDGGFEANANNGTNPNWTSTSTLFGSSLCNIAGCGAGASPRTGNGWIWFDGAATGASAESGTVRQTITIQAGRTATLSYYFRAPRVTAPSSTVLTVTVDGTVVQTINEPATAEAAYTLRTVDLSAFANGAPRLLSFNYSRPAGTTGSDDFLIDDVTLSTACVQGVASVTGRVTTPSGLGLRNAVVTVIDPLGVRRTATTSSFGVFNFAGVPTGPGYVISVSSKRYRFAPQTMTINGNLANVDFTGLE